ncbi:MAG TPA: SDR family oxidoreductase [candidate division Zixibacteria bacterium]|nr:SDR family oxidoreductase [candidate division Zixibacteria bacterium]
MDFRNQVILITGASSGIGRRLAEDLAERGAVIAGCGRSPERLASMLAAVKDRSPASAVFPCDVGRREEVERMAGEVLDRFGRIDVLVNNAGIGMRMPFSETPLETIEEIMRTNYLGTVYCTRAVLPSMVARGRGHIVNISSVAGKIGALNMAGYCASKFAVNGLSESLCHELRPLGISVSVICPGPVRTVFNREFADVPPRSPPALVIGVEAVSRAVIAALETRKPELVLPRWLAVACWLKRIAPNLFRVVYHRQFGLYASRSRRSP